MSFLRFKGITPTRSKDYFKLGGPRSFHKFTYNKSQLILMGECHEKMPPILVNQYADVINPFIEKNNNIKLFLEKRNTVEEKEEKSADEMSFLHYMGTLPSSSHMQVINSDDRDQNIGFTNFYLFLNNMLEIEQGIIDLYKEKEKTPPSNLFSIASNVPGYIQKFEDLSSFHEKGYTLGNLQKLLSSSIVKLDQLHDQYSKMNETIGEYIAYCRSKLNDILTMSTQISDEYHSLHDKKQQNSNDIANTSLLKICLELIIHKRTFDAVRTYRNLYLFYITYFLNATLICKLWDELNNSDQEKILMIVAGEGHTESLAVLFRKLCTTEVSISSNPNGAIISPEFISEYLNNNFEHAPKRGSTCVVH